MVETGQTLRAHTINTTAHTTTAFHPIGVCSAQCSRGEVFDDALVIARVV